MCKQPSILTADLAEDPARSSQHHETPFSYNPCSVLKLVSHNAPIAANVTRASGTLASS